MIYHVGFTIGPIFDTILNATTPAALWFASCVFSDLSRRICAAVTETIPEAFIYTPYYDPDSALDDGLGKYHDRILFSVEAEQEELKNALKAIREKTIQETAEVFPQEDFDREKLTAFLAAYLQVHWLILPESELKGENPALTLSPMLDTLELIRTFPSDDGNDPFRRLFISSRAATRNGESNRMIKSSPLFTRINKTKCFLINKEENIRDINAIAARLYDGYENEMPRVDFRSDRYYAVVSADGDGLTNFFKGLPSTSEVQVFSEACLAFAGLAAEEIVAFGGVPIYAGGDDLLFLAPVIGQEKREITALCADLRNLFRETLEKKMGDAGLSTSNLPTMSFGIAVQYCKFPLYEAHQRSADLLEAAKKHDKKKDRILLDLRKHSGQSLAFSFPNSAVEDVKMMLDAARGKKMSSTQLHSVGYTLSNFAPLFSILLRDFRGKGVENEEGFVDRWMNLFDNPDQQVGEEYLKQLGSVFYRCMVSKDCGLTVPDSYMSMTRTSVLQRENEPDKEAVWEWEQAALQALINLLAWERFLSMKEGERE